MDNNKILDNTEIWKYASDMIAHEPKFYDFAMAMMELDEETAPYIFSMYYVLRTSMGMTETSSEMSEMQGWSESERLEWLHSKYAEYKRKRQKNVNIDDLKDDIDHLQFLIEEFRNNEKFQRMLDFVGRFHYLAPYNAMLVSLQKPGAEFVFSSKVWMRKYKRQPKPNAQKLITLVPFGPVQLMFDFEDTEPIPGCRQCTEFNDLVNEWNSSLMKASGKVDPKIWDNLIENMPAYGIRFDEEFNAANTYGGYLRMTNKHTVNVAVTQGRMFMPRARFVLSVNRKQSRLDKFATICHELGHLFCRHLFYDVKKMRNGLSHKEEEFEAETVAWLVCKRHGVNNPSEEYLATYARDGEIPTCSVETILTAVTEIEKMLHGVVPANKGLWYKHDTSFKDEYDKIKQEEKKRNPRPTRKGPGQLSWNL